MDCQLEFNSPCGGGGGGLDFFDQSNANWVANGGQLGSFGAGGVPDCGGNGSGGIVCHVNGVGPGGLDYPLGYISSMFASDQPRTILNEMYTVTWVTTSMYDVLGRLLQNSGGYVASWASWNAVTYGVATYLPSSSASSTEGGHPANNGQPQHPKKSGCGLAVAQGAISVGLDIVGAIPGFGNAVSATAAGARAVNGIVAYGGAAYGIATGLPDESPVGAAGAGAGLGLTLADAALEGGKVIPVLGNALSATIGLYDGYQLAKTIQKCW